MIDAIHARLREADADENVRAIIITSALPGMFCGGMDLRMVAAGDAMDLRRFVDKFYIDTMNIQYALSKPTIVAVNGPARGAGMTLSITSDVILAADDVDLGYPEINIGVIPAIHYVHLPGMAPAATDWPQPGFRTAVRGPADPGRGGRGTRYHQPRGAARSADRTRA